MVAGDAIPVPQKNIAYRVTFPILDADGDLVTGAAALDSESSLDAGTFADLTAEATEIATSSGMYFLELTAAEMNGDTIAVIVKTTTTGAKTTPIVMYPEEAGNIRVNVTQISGDATAADNEELFFDGTGYNAANSTIGTATALGAGAVSAAAIATGAIDADALAADASTEIRSLASGTADSGSTTTMVDAARTEADTDYWAGQIIVFTSGTLLGQARQITAFNAATDTITFAPATTVAVLTHTYEIWPSDGSLRPTVVGRTLDVTATGEAGIDLDNTVGTLAKTTDITGFNDLTAAAVNAEVVDALATDTYVESAGVVAATATLAAKISWLATLARNKITQTATTQALRNDADAANIATAAVSDDGTTATRAEWV